MGGITMWIILGSLIGLVIIFLVVTSIFDRKKRTKALAEQKEIDFKVDNSGTNVSKAAVKAINTNEKELKNFVPAVGKKKMSDINSKAKMALQKIKDTEDFKFLKHNEVEFKEFSANIDALIQEKSNNWSKRNAKNIEFFKNYKAAPKPTPKKVKSKKGRK